MSLGRRSFLKCMVATIVAPSLPAAWASGHLLETAVDCTASGQRALLSARAELGQWLVDAIEADMVESLTCNPV